MLVNATPFHTGHWFGGTATVRLPITLYLPSQSTCQWFVLCKGSKGNTTNGQNPQWNEINSQSPRLGSREQPVKTSIATRNWQKKKYLCPSPPFCRGRNDLTVNLWQLLGDLESSFHHQFWLFFFNWSHFSTHFHTYVQPTRWTSLAYPLDTQVFWGFWTWTTSDLQKEAERKTSEPRCRTGGLACSFQMMRPKDLGSDLSSLPCVSKK